MADPRPTVELSPIDEDPILDLKGLGQSLGFVQHAIGRHKRLVFSTLLAAGVVVALLCLLLPRVYKVSVRVLTHRSSVMAALVHPDRSIPQSADNPTLGAVELIKSRDNLANLMDDISLEETWDKNRSALMKWKDFFLGKVGMTPLLIDKKEAFLKLLDDRLVATVIDEVVSMDVEWPDAEIAMKLAEAALARFLKIRHDMELSEILATVTILKRNVEASRTSIENRVEHMQKIVDAKEREFDARGNNRGSHRGRRTRVIAIRKPLGASQADPVGDELRRALSEKQQLVSSLKRNQDARLKKEQDELTHLRESLGPQHPDYLEQARKVEEAKQAPPEQGQALQEIARLNTQLSVMPAAARDSAAPKTQEAGASNPGDDADLMRVPVSDELFGQIDKDPEIAAVLEEIKKLEDTHDDLLQRLKNAHIESESANVAFSYRYLVTKQPVMPKKYVKPNLVLLGVGGLMVALFLGLLFSVLADLRSEKVLEAWQIERYLKLKLLGEVDEL